MSAHEFKMPDMNIVMIAGRLTRDPELQYLKTGSPLCKFSVAVDRKFKGKDGQLKDEVCFPDIVVWGQSAEWVGENTRKGTPVIVQGRLTQETWKDTNTGQQRSKMTVTAFNVQSMEWGPRSEGSTTGSPSQQQGAKRPTEDPAEESYPEDDVPY